MATMKISILSFLPYPIRVQAHYLALCENFQEEDLLALLREEDSAEDKMIQTDISDADLERILDRSDLIAPSGSDNEKSKVSGDLYPLKGPGWEVVTPTSTGGVLSTLNS